VAIPGSAFTSALLPVAGALLLSLFLLIGILQYGFLPAS
jgi:hypothetical protein